MDKSVLVSISIITYKHEAFIAQAVEGVLMQETNFEYEIIIADDYSPDGTEEIVRRLIITHPKGNLIKYFRQPQNVGMHNNAACSVKHCSGK